MRRRAIGVLLVAVAGTPVGAAGSQPNLRLGKAVRHGALEVFPLWGPRAQAAADYLLLEEGLRSGKVKIEERAGGGSVPELLLDNRSRRPLLLVSGEVVYGGKQDRVIREDTIIPPMASRVPISVYCVEQGRWGGGKSFEKVGGFALPRVMKAASFAAQGDVWRAVREEALKARARGDPGAVTATGTLKAVLGSKRAAKDAEPFLRAAEKIFRGRTLPVGFVVAIGGKPQAAHVFASAGLAYKLSRRLLQSYALEAARSDVKVGAAKIADVRAFLAEAMKDRGKVHRDLDAVQNLSVTGSRGQGKATVDKKEGRTIHRSYFAH